MLWGIGMENWFGFFEASSHVGVDLCLQLQGWKDAPGSVKVRILLNTLFTACLDLQKLGVSSGLLAL